MTSGRAVHHSLGAEELIELGRSRSENPDRKPFFLGRVRLGSPAAEYLAGRFSEEKGLLERISGKPGSGAGLSGMVKTAPATREALARVLVLGGAMISEGMRSEGDALGSVLTALEGSGTPDDNGKLLEVAAEKIVFEAPPEVRESVAQVLKVG